MDSIMEYLNCLMCDASNGYTLDKTRKEKKDTEKGREKSNDFIEKDRTLEKAERKIEPVCVHRVRD